jgi:hypothetical protein
MKKVLIALSLFLFLGCSPQTPDVISGIQYMKDPKTGLCFAYTVSQSYPCFYVTSITCVPCQALVEAQALADEEKFHNKIEEMAKGQK